MWWYWTDRNYAICYGVRCCAIRPRWCQVMVMVMVMRLLLGMMVVGFCAIRHGAACCRGGVGAIRPRWCQVMVMVMVMARCHPVPVRVVVGQRWLLGMRMVVVVLVGSSVRWLHEPHNGWPVVSSSLLMVMMVLVMCSVLEVMMVLVMCSVLVLVMYSVLVVLMMMSPVAWCDGRGGSLV